jgi:uncharacterized protein (DUF1697 family)
MVTCVALLRGINVGGRHTVAMADLRQLCEDLGLDDVRTYVQSGNVVFRTAHPSPEAIGGELTDRLTSQLGVAPTVLVRTAEELATAVAENPFAQEAAADPASVHVAFLATEPSDPAVLTFDAAQYAPERIAGEGRIRYLHLPDGIGRSALATAVSRRSDVEVTVRNWRTVTRLHELARG